MIEVELQISDSVDAQAVTRIVEQVCASQGLTATLKGTLVGYPGSIHWHFKLGKQKGVLEITSWESQHRLWFKVASGRTSEWIIQNIPQLKDRIEKLLL